MLFDWFTFFAQLINFLVLAWLLKRLLYKPILKTVDERGKLIAGQIQEAETLQKRAGSEYATFTQKNTEFEEHKHKLLETVRSEIASERQKLEEQTRNEIEQLRFQLLEDLKKEQKNLNSEVIDMAKAGVFSIARKTLSDLASKNLEEQIIEVFISRIKNLDPSEKNLMITEINKAQGKFNIRCVFEISSRNQKMITAFFENEINEISTPVFDFSPKLISGIELLAGGYKMVWNIDNYLVELENNFEELLEAKS